MTSNTSIKVTDRIQIEGTHVREDGYLVVDAKVARTGIQDYLGSEIGVPDKDVVKVYRPPEEVFDKAAMASFAHRPVTNDHPPEDVTAENWKRFAVGQTADEVRQDGTVLRVPLMVADAAAIQDIQNGKREWSNGYDCVFDFTPGVTPEGEVYDAVQRTIRGNHVALVDAGRAGKECRIGDNTGSAKWGASPVTTADLKGRTNMTTENLQQKVVDGFPVMCTDAASIAIDKLVGDRNDLQAKLDAAVADAKAATETHQKELATKDAEIDGLKGKIVDGAALDALVAKRATLLDTAKKIVPDLKVEGMADADIRKAVVVAKCGDKVLEGREGAALDAYVDARFDTLVEDAAQTKPSDQFAGAFTADGKPALVVDNGTAEAARQKAFDALIAYDRTGVDPEAKVG